MASWARTDFRLQAGVLLLEQRVRVFQASVFDFERGAAHALGGHVLLITLQTSVGVGQAVLEDALEAGFGVALL